MRIVIGGRHASDRDPVLVLSLLLLLPVCSTRPGVDRRAGQGRVRRGAAGRDRGSVEPGADREGAVGRRPTAAGQYRIELLPPGDYTVTFTLPGFSTVKREGIQLDGHLHRHDRHRPPRRRDRGNHYRHRRDADRRRAERHTPARHRSRADRQPAGRPVALRADGAAFPASPCQRPTRTSAARRQLSGAISMQIHGTTGASQLLHGKRSVDRGAGVAGELADHVQHGRGAGDCRSTIRAPAADNNAAGVRMNVIPREGGNTFNGTLFLNGTTERAAGQQLLAAAARCRAADARRDPQAVRHQSRIRRPAPSATSCGSMHRAAARVASRWAGRRVLRQELQQPERLDLRADLEPAGVQRLRRQRRTPAPDMAGRRRR